jgi:hypothetical protein
MRPEQSGKSKLEAQQTTPKQNLDGPASGACRPAKSSCQQPSLPPATNPDNDEQDVGHIPEPLDAYCAARDFDEQQRLALVTSVAKMKEQALTDPVTARETLELINGLDALLGSEKGDQFIKDVLGWPDGLVETNIGLCTSLRDNMTSESDADATEEPNEEELCAESIQDENQQYQENDDEIQPGQGDTLVAVASTTQPIISAHEGVEAKKPEIVEIELSKIDLKHAIQVRASLKDKVVEEYRQRMLNGDSFPPIAIFRVNDVLAMTDGGHRVEATKRAGKQTIQAVIYDGTEADAIRAAIKANSTHGLPRTNADKRNAVLMALKAFPGDSDCAIAELSGVSHTFIAKLRKQLATVASSKPRRGRDGKKRALPKSKSKKESSQNDQSEEEAKDSVPGSTSGDQPQSTAKAEVPAENSTDTGNQDGPSNDTPPDCDDVVYALLEEIEGFIRDRVQKLSDPQLEIVAIVLRAMANEVATWG